MHWDVKVNQMILNNCLAKIVIVKLFLVTKILLRNSAITLLIFDTYGDNFSDSSPFENYMSGANVCEPFKLLTASLEALEAIVVPQKKPSLGRD